MSKRKEINDKIVAFLRSKPEYNAVYGIMESLRPLGAGKMREIKCGIKGKMDLTIEIVKENEIHVSAIGAHAKVCLLDTKQTFADVEDLLMVLDFCRLEPWQIRVVQEQISLKSKIDALRVFLKGPEYRRLLPEDSSLLDRQFEYMEAYGRTLEKRIKRFK